MSAVQLEAQGLGESAVEEFAVPRRSRERFATLDPLSYERAERALNRSRKHLAGEAIWHVSRSSGDGVAEMLRSLLGYSRDAGIDAHWLVASGDHGFHRLTRRLYNRLYGSSGDGGPLGIEERKLYERVAAEQAPALVERVRPGDVVFLHDVAGLVEPLVQTGAQVVYRCHLGVEEPNEQTREAWEFLWPLVANADAYVFSRPEYVWEQVPDELATVLRPGADPFSPKNQHLDPDVVLAVLDQIGLTDYGVDCEPVFTRTDGSPHRFGATAQIDQDDPIPAGAPVIAQVSGWERLKGQAGLLELFAEQRVSSSAHLVIAGPEIEAKQTPTEEDHVWEELGERRRVLAKQIGERIHLAQLPLADLEENATMVNAIQRLADVVVHNAIEEGFGLSVTEAMLKGKAVIGTRIGGIEEQIADGVSGVLVDRDDQEALGRAIDELLADPQRRTELGTAARIRAISEFSTARQLVDYVELIEELHEG